VNCPDCGSNMVEGFIPDATYGAVLQAGWHAGKPEESSFFGLKTGIRYDKEVVMPITTYRCTHCGLLRSYARSKQR